MNKLARKIELLANVAIIALALLLGGVFINRYFFSEMRAPEVRVGDKITLSGMDWTKNGHTLLLVLQSECKYCSESAPFYQRLVRELRNQNGVRLIAILPQLISESQKYLSEHGILIDEVQQASLDSMNVAGTPTLILVDKTGTISDVWLGKLTPAQETYVLSRLRANAQAKAMFHP